MSKGYNSRKNRLGLTRVIGGGSIGTANDHGGKINRVQRTLSSELSKSFAISSSDGSPPAVTSDANVKVQYDSLLFAGAMVKSSCVKSAAQCCFTRNTRRRLSD